jgi:hypothetical protein
VRPPSISQIASADANATRSHCDQRPLACRRATSGCSPARRPRRSTDRRATRPQPGVVGREVRGRQTARRLASVLPDASVPATARVGREDALALVCLHGAHRPSSSRIRSRSSRRTGHDRELEAQPRHARHLENPRARRSTAGRAHENGVAHRVRKRDVITAEKRDARARLDEPSSVERRCAKVPRRRTAVPECGHAACAQTRAGAVRQAVGRPVQTCRMDREARSPIPPAGPLAGDRHACVAPGGRERSRRSVRPRLTAVARQPVVQPALATACAAGAEPAQRLEEPWVPSVASPAPRDRARDVGCESGSRHPWIPAGRRDGRVLLFAG